MSLSSRRIDLKTFTSSEPLSSQIQFCCPYCPLSFAQVGTLRVHIHRKHREQRASDRGLLDRPSSPIRFLCKYCSNTYSSKDSRRNHVKKLHKKEKEADLVCLEGKRPLCPDQQVYALFECKYCSKRYSSKDSLRVHINRCHKEQKLAEKALVIANKDDLEVVDAIIIY